MGKAQKYSKNGKKVVNRTEKEHVSEDHEFETRKRYIEIKDELIKRWIWSSLKKVIIPMLVFFIFAILLNTKIIEIPNEDSLSSIDILILILKAATILLFIFFAIIFTGNLKELLGKSMSILDLILIYIFGLLISIVQINVFATVLIGEIILTVYFYFIQGKLTEQYEVENAVNSFIESSNSSED